MENDIKILEQLGISTKNCLGFDVEFRPGAHPKIKVHYFSDKEQEEKIIDIFSLYQLEQKNNQFTFNDDGSCNDHINFPLNMGGKHD